MRLEFAHSAPTIRQTPLLPHCAACGVAPRFPFTELRAAFTVLRAKPIQDFRILRIDDREKTLVARELP